MPSFRQPESPASYLLTFDGSVQNVLAALGIDVSDGGENSIVEILVQADPGNAAAAELGDASVDTTGVQIPAASGGVAAAPIKLGPYGPRQCYLSQLYAKGTAGQKLRLLVIPYNV